MHSRLNQILRTLAAASAVVVTLATPSLTASAQAIGPTIPVATVPYPTGPKISRIDLYGGYAYLRPVDSAIGGYFFQPINPGAVTSVTGYLTRNLGVQAEGSFFPHGPNDCAYSAQAGPIARANLGRFVPFVHALGGGAKVGGPVFQPCVWGFGFTGGLGVDYIVPGFGDHLALRPIQADYQYDHVDHGPLVLPAGVTGGTAKLNAVRLSGGIVLRFGDMTPAPPVALTCSLQPDSVFPGDPISVTASPVNLNPKKSTTYTWKSTGGELSGNGANVNISTTGTPSGAYVVTGHVAQGAKPGQMADCSTNFTVKAFEPPTITCSADPSTVKAGDSSTITSTGLSPQNRPLTYTFSASSGQVSGTGNTNTLATAGVAPGTINVTCNVVDDLGHTATATTSVMVTAPYVPPAPQAQPLCGLTFDRDHKRPNRVDNESKACLDDIALTLQRDSASTLVIVGNHTSEEKPQAGAERGLNVRQYLVDEKGIDPSRIEVRSGDAGTRTVENSLIPAGAAFTGTASTVDATAIHRTGQPYGKPRPANAPTRHPRKKKKH